jgi:NAD+ kinase
MKPIRSILFVPNGSKPEAAGIADKLRSIAEKQGVTAAVETRHPLPAGSLRDYDLCCVIGGDGTLLSVAAEAIPHDTALLGINVGKLGFLATLSGEAAEAGFAEILAGEYAIHTRAVFEVHTASGESAYALNDVVIKEARGYGLIRLQVKANDRRVSEYHSDGLIFSTPTGSTAYNLSAGGPIVAPDARVFVMTPICPHTFGNRSVVFDSDAEITVENREPQHVPTVSVDGRQQLNMDTGFPLRLSISTKVLHLLQKKDYAPFQIVREKLQWGDPAIPVGQPLSGA